MLKTLPRPEANLSENAPRLLVTNINPEKIGMLIGPGGKNIRAIQEETNTVVEVSEAVSYTHLTLPTIYSV